jgi:hypothetical protein
MIRFWIPAVFCASLSGIMLWQGRSNPYSPAFYSFLPMCFVFVGSLMWQMQREIRALREQLAELRAK